MQKNLRDHLIELLDGRQAHLDFASVVGDFPLERIGEKPASLPHSAWELLEHLRITQKDILDFSKGTDYQELQWPDEYWPKRSSPEGPNGWDETVKSFQADMKEFQKLVRDEAVDLLASFPWGAGQTLLREALLLADHNSYHLGQLVSVKRALLG